MPNKRKCRHKLCDNYGNPGDMLIVPLGAFCDDKCMLAYTKDKQVKQRSDAKLKQHKNKEMKERKAAFYADKITAQDIDHARRHLHWWVVNVRDKDKPCISCGDGWGTVQWEAGHYQAVGSKYRKSFLRFDPRNIHKQCNTCNCNKDGNVAEYSLGLDDRYGREYLEELKEQIRIAQTARPLTKQEIRAIGDKYREINKTHQK